MEAIYWSSGLQSLNLKKFVVWFINLKDMKQALLGRHKMDKNG